MAEQIVRKSSRQNFSHEGASIKLIITAGYNNMFITAIRSGQVIASSSSGMVAKHSRKSTPLAGQRAALLVIEKLIELKITEISALHVRGFSAGRDQVIRSICASQLSVKLIRDITPIPHNGCRPPKKRRV